MATLQFGERMAIREEARMSTDMIERCAGIHAHVFTAARTYLARRTTGQAIGPRLRPRCRQ
jgi:hypothetical protein